MIDLNNLPQITKKYLLGIPLYKETPFIIPEKVFDYDDNISSLVLDKKDKFLIDSLKFKINHIEYKRLDEIGLSELWISLTGFKKPSLQDIKNSVTYSALIEQYNEIYNTDINPDRLDYVYLITVEKIKEYR